MSSEPSAEQADATPLVSAVIATRDRPVMVREAVDAALAQDYPGPLEVVLVYDQSEPDHTMARSEGNRSVRVVTNERSPGLAGARNTGVLAARGEFVAFCDDDDLWLPGKVRRQVTEAQAEPDTVLVTCGIRVEYDGQAFERSLPLTRVSLAEMLRDRHTELHPSTFLLRRQRLLDLGMVDEGVPGGFGEDYELLLRVARAHPIANLPEVHTVVRWGKQSFFFRRWETMTDGLSWLLDRYPEFEQSRRGSARVRGQIAFAEAARGRRREALRWAGSAWRRDPRQPRIYLAGMVASRLVTPDRVMERLHRRGKGI